MPMKRFFVCIIVILSIIGGISISGAPYNTQFIEKVKMDAAEIPEGYAYGKIPDFARNVLKDNPWFLDREAIKKLADRIYPGGDYNKISIIHMTILASNKNPYGDDIVCYIIVYDRSAAKDEMEKLSTYIKYNSDRAIALCRDNLAVVFFVDEVNDFHFIQEMAKNMDARLNSL
jgi:hypothetical protein